MQSLPIFVKLRGEPVLLMGEGEGAEPKRRLLEAAGANIVTEPAPGVRVAILAIDDEGEAAAAAAPLRAAGLLVNVVDKPRLCDFSFPAIVDRAPVTIAVGSGGASATLSKTVRERLEALLPARLGAIADAARRTRAAVNAAFGDPAERRLFWDRLMAPGGALDPLADPPADPDETVRAALSGASAQPRLQEFTLASADPDDLTLRQLRALSQADLVLYEPGIAPAVLGRARRDSERAGIESGAPVEGMDGLTVVLRTG
ncbi:MAG: NAD(P)-dependent oxidoreductase [Pacificimonas sp.]|jgi:uroporphyrin-III C-methyltransferase/precorrin-2 dehydrogenase/sirohydrochlorin ferrochelatase|nr:NAD(P)-dependent oxidoreductase [Pacificimonas sp.]